MALDQTRVKKIGLVSAVLIPLLLVLFLVVYLVFFMKDPTPVVYYPEDDVPHTMDNVVPEAVPGTAEQVDMPEAHMDATPADTASEAPVTDSVSE